MKYTILSIIFLICLSACQKDFDPFETTPVGELKASSEGRSKTEEIISEAYRQGFSRFDSLILKNTSPFTLDSPDYIWTNISTSNWSYYYYVKKDTEESDAYLILTHSIADDFKTYEKKTPSRYYVERCYPIVKTVIATIEQVKRLYVWMYVRDWVKFWNYRKEKHLPPFN